MTIRRNPGSTVLRDISIWAASMLLCVLAIGRPGYPAEPVLKHYPDVSGDTVVFESGGDLWSGPVTGGVARRLTVNDGEERSPKFSPDGSLIAFTGEYDGNADVYVMTPDGGNITRLTYHPGTDEVVGWHPTRNKILFRSSRHSYSRFTRLYLISPDGTGLEELILPEVSRGSYSPDGSQIVYNKVAREHRNWDRYVGGLAQELYLYNFQTGKNQRLTNFRGTDRLPMWIGDKIYFSSDRDGRLNLYQYDPASGATTQVTRHTEYDVRWPSAGGRRIVYQLGADLWVLDTRNNQTRKIPVEVRSDAPEARPYLENVRDYITGIDCSPAGNRALAVARGDVFTVPREHGPVRNLTQSSGARDRGAVWSPDGHTIAYLSDADGEYQIYTIDARGGAAPEKLTGFQTGYRHALHWAPDSKKIAFTDQTLTLYYLDVQSGKLTSVDKAAYENVDVSLDRKPISDLAWSPDSRFLAYSKMDSNLVYQIYLFSLGSGDIHHVSQGLFSDFSPVFSKDGEHLFFISNRRFDPTFSDLEWEMVYKDVAGIYALTLRKNGPPLLPLRSDEVAAEQPAPSSGTKAPKTQASQVEIDFEGLAGRLEALPLARGNYRRLAANESHLYYLNKENGDFNRFDFREVGPMNLYAFSFADREERPVVEKVDRYRLSSDGSRIVYNRGDEIGIVDAAATQSEEHQLDLADLSMDLHPREEWRQIFNEAWRMERDYYYEPGMHGLDWDAVRVKYARLLPAVTNRSDLVFLIGSMIAELSTSHTYVWGGDEKRTPDRVNVGMLGADWQVDTKQDLYRFKKIYRTADWTEEVVPPLAQPGVDVQEGDYLLAVNGAEVTADHNIYSYFQNLAGKQVVLLVNEKPTVRGAREVTVKPLRSESTLRYRAWVEHNRQVVDRESNGTIGYLHLPDTYLGSAAEFPKYFYSQTRKQGLIIDGRFNAGGLDPDIFLRRLNRPVLAYWTRRYSHDQTIPETVTRAHMVCITNRQAGSGGDMLPWEFRQLGMGPIIGTRTWGGLVGVSMFIRMVDGGTLTAPNYRIYDPSGDWVVENQGIRPDIVVDLDPREMARGYDAQLMRAVQELQQVIAADPIVWPRHPPYPADQKMPAPGTGE